jgi:hypothetical protein
MAVNKLLRDNPEDNVLTLLCWDYDRAPAVALRVTAALFSTREYQRIAHFALEHIERYGVPPRRHLRDYLEGEMKTRDASFLRQIIAGMEALHPELQGDFVEDVLDKFIEKRTIAMAMDAGYTALDKDDIEGAREALAQASATAKPREGVYLHETEKWLSFLHRKEGIEFSSGVDLLDERGIHPDRGELYLFMGPRKSGKTWALIQIGRRAVEARHDVLHITLENSSAITQMRYTQAFLQMTVEQTRTMRVPLFTEDNIGRFRLDVADQAPRGVIHDNTSVGLGLALEPYTYTGELGSAGRLLVQEFPTGTMTIGQLTSLLDRLERADGFKPDIVVLDYINLMDIGDVRQHRLSLGRMGVALRGVAVSRHIAMVTATQTNRLSATAKVVTGTHVAEDWSLAGTADTVVTYSQSKEERELNLARVYIDAARNAPDKWMAQISQSYVTGQFCLNSVLQTKWVAEEIARQLGEEGEETGYARSPTAY